MINDDDFLRDLLARLKLSGEEIGQLSSDELERRYHAAVPNADRALLDRVRGVVVQTSGRFGVRYPK